jgi:two-component system, NarL family, nitrate/nitrite response regulator NarL
MIGRILVVENELPWQERLADAMRAEGYEVYLAMSLEEARQLLYQIKPDILTLDMELRAYRMQGWTLLDELDVMPNSPEVIIVSEKIDRQDIQRLWRGYDIFDVVLKENYGNGRYFIQTVRDALEAKRRADAEEDAIETPAEPLATSEADAPYPLTEAERAVLREVARGKLTSEGDTSYSLTEKEKAVLREVARGKSNKEIAQTLRVSINTIKKHLANASAPEKLDTTGRINLVNKARELGYIPREE